MILFIAAFVSGAALMALELVGSRLLAPYFGNSIFVWGSLISVFLASLSGGYFIGGIISDRAPRQWILGCILIVCGILVFSLPFIYPALNSWIFQHDFDYRMNPLAASAALFLLPGMGMGMVSPYVIKLSVKKLETVGNLAGTIYAISTIGSIVGTLGSAFFMIPTWGTRFNLRLLGMILVTCGLMVVLIKNSARIR